MGVKVCLHSHDFYPTVGGIQRCSAVLADYLHGQGVEVCIVTATPSTEPDRFPYPVMRRPAPGELWRTLARCDLVHVNGYSLRLLPWALLLRRPIVYTHAGYQAICPNGLAWYDGMRSADYRLGRCLAEERKRFGYCHAAWELVKTLAHRSCLPLADCHICLSHTQLGRIRPPRAVLIPLPCDPALRCMNYARVSGRFTFFGRLVGEKGVDVLLEALAECHSRGHRYGLDIFGEGPRLGDLVHRAAALGLQDYVAFLGFRAGDALRQAISAAWIVVVPSIWEEPGATIAVELLSCGKAVIAARRGATGEIIGPCGLLFDNGDARDLARRMIELGSDPFLRHELEMRGPHLSGQYSIREVGRQHLELYERVLRRAGKLHDHRGLSRQGDKA